MSYYLKRMAVLKQAGTGFSMTGKALSGIARAEKTGLNVKITLSVVNLAPVSEGGYFAAASGGEDICFFSLEKSGTEFSAPASPYIDIQDGFSCLICFVFQSQITAVAFGGAGKAASIHKLQAALEHFVNTGAQTKSSAKQQTEQGSMAYNIPKENPANMLQSDQAMNYQDEIVATDNYYLYNDVDINNLSVKERIDEPQELSNTADTTEKTQTAADRTLEKEQATVERELGTERASIAKLFSDSGAFDRDGLTQGQYFDKVKSELETLFSEHPREESLEKNIPGSKWVRIYYSDGKYYTVGLITDNKKPAYICYGVPGKYSKEPPAELKGFCSYLPLSLFDLRGDGYWMMYQSAKTGECVHIDFI